MNTSPIGFNAGFVGRFFTCLSLVIVGALVSGCGASPTQQCKDLVNTQCQRVFECYATDVKTSAQFIAQFGSTQTECNNKLNSNVCATTTDSNPCNDSSKKYDSNKASNCIQDYKNASCETIKGGTFTSGNCNTICG